MTMPAGNLGSAGGGLPSQVFVCEDHHGITTRIMAVGGKLYCAACVQQTVQRALHPVQLPKGD